MILHRILAHKKTEVAANKSNCPLSRLQEMCDTAKAPRSLESALRSTVSKPALIAEIKRKSPSRGLIRRDFNPSEIAGTYKKAGAAAISVLTDEHFFGGKLEFLSVVRKTVDLPLLRKDFIIDPYQVYEARAYGADALLLIVAALKPERLAKLLQLTTALGMEALVEVHTRSELEVAIAVGASIIGINNRNLSTFETSLRVTEALAPLVPAGKTLVSESGIHSHADAQLVARAGASGILVGEALMREEDLARAVERLQGDEAACL